MDAAVKRKYCGFTSTGTPSLQTSIFQKKYFPDAASYASRGLLVYSCHLGGGSLCPTVVHSSDSDLQEAIRVRPSRELDNRRVVMIGPGSSSVKHSKLVGKYNWRRILSRGVPTGTQ